MPKSKLYVKLHRAIWRNDKGEYHREDGPSIVYANGSEEWFLNGLSHREGGPAVVFPEGDNYWYLYGQRHREGGPACLHSDGTKYWYLNGLKYTEKEYNDQFKTLR